MKTYCTFKASEVDTIVKALTSSPIRREKMLGNRIKKSLKEHGGEAPCDMELIGADDEEMSDDEE